MLLLLLNPSARVAARRCWYKQPLLFAMLINLVLVWLMYWLTIGNQSTSTTRTVSSSTVFEARKTEKVEPEVEQLFEMSQAPQSASIPPPPMAVNLATTTFDSALSLPNIVLPLDINKPNLQMVNLTFSPQGNVAGSVMNSAMAEAKPVLQIPPQYPAKAKQDGIEGYVTLALNINADGRVEEIKVVAEHPVGVFARSAQRAVIRWRFVASVQGQWQRITIRYELEK